MANSPKKHTRREKRHNRIRRKVNGKEDIPRLVVFRSNRYTYAQIIDDSKGKTVTAVSTAAIINKDSKSSKVDAAFALGEDLAKLARGKKILKVVFDRAGYKYHGRVKALAQGARKGGLTF